MIVSGPDKVKFGWLAFRAPVQNIQKPPKKSPHRDRRKGAAALVSENPDRVQEDHDDRDRDQELQQQEPGAVEKL